MAVLSKAEQFELSLGERSCRQHLAEPCDRAVVWLSPTSQPQQAQGPMQDGVMGCMVTRAEEILVAVPPFFLRLFRISQTWWESLCLLIELQVSF